MAMTQASGAASPAPESDRLRRTSLTSRLLGRPSAGALLITFFVWIVFAVLSALNGGGVFYGIDGTLNYLDVAAQVGIVGTAVALLMIAGEFDLSIGSLIGFAGIVIGICVTTYGLPVWAGDPHLARADDAPGGHQRLHRRPDGPAIVHRHAGDAVHHPRRDPGADRADHQDHLHPDRPGAHRRRPDRRDLQLEHRQLQGLDPVVDPARGRRGLHPRPDQVRQLDRRRRRLAERGAQPGRPGRPGQDHRCSPGRPSRPPSWPPSRA